MLLIIIIPRGETFIKHAKYKHHDYLKLLLLLYIYDLTTYSLIIINVILF